MEKNGFRMPLFLEKFQVFSQKIPHFMSFPLAKNFYCGIIISAYKNLIEYFQKIPYLSW